MKRLHFVSIFFVSLMACNQSRTIHPTRKNIIETVYASGKLMADSEYTVYALNPGTVTKKLVKEGDEVGKGQVLYVINNTAPAARLEAADVSYANARQNLSANSRILGDLRLSMQNADIKFSNDSLQYQRLKALWADNVGTRSALDNAEVHLRTSQNEKQSARERYYSTINDLNVALKNAHGQLATAQNDLNNFIIRAESPGTIYQMMKEKGESVRANDPVALVGKSAERIIRLSVDQQDIDKIKIGQQVLLKTDISGDKIYQAVVTRTFPVMNESDQTFRVEAAFVNADKQPFIHSSVEANIIVQRKQQCLVVPSQVLLAGDSLKTKQDGQVKTVAVKTGIHTIDNVEILGGVDQRSDIVLPSRK